VSVVSRKGREAGTEYRAARETALREPTLSSTSQSRVAEPSRARSGALFLTRCETFAATASSA